MYFKEDSIFMATIISFSPIIISVIVLIYALRRSFNKRALIVSAALTMITEMMMMKNNNSWYVLLFSLTVPLAISYVVICLVLSIMERREK